MKYLGYDVCASTVKHILDDFGIVPDPERRKRGDWNQFIETQQHVTAATDFAQVIFRSELRGCAGKVFQAAGMAVPPTVRFT